LFSADGRIGSPFVVTSNNGGHSPDAIAELCVNKIIQVSDNAPPEIAQQARAYREYLLKVVAFYLRMAVTEDRSTIAMKLEHSGLRDVARQIRSL